MQFDVTIEVPRGQRNKYAVTVGLTFRADGPAIGGAQAQHARLYRDVHRIAANRHAAGLADAVRHATGRLRQRLGA